MSKRLYRPARFNNFKGLDTVNNPSNKDPMRSNSLWGVESWPQGCISKWLGREKYHATAIGATVKVKSVHELRLRAGTTKQIVSCDDGKIYYHSGADTWTQLDNGLGTSDNPHSTVDYLNEYIITDFGQSAPQSWNGAAANTSDVDATCPNGYTCAKFKRRLWMLGTSSNTHLAYYSNLDSKVFVQASQYLTFDAEPGYRLMGGCVQGDRLIVGKDASIIEIYHTGSKPPFAKRILSANIGCAAPFSWQNIEEIKAAIFVGFNNVYMVLGAQVIPIGNNIINYFESSLPGESINKNKLLNVVSGVNIQKHQYWFAAPSSGSSTNNMLFKYDYITGEWFVGPAIISALGSFRISGEDRLYSGDYTGLVYREDYGNDDAGEDYTTYRNSSWSNLNFEGKKKITRIEFLLEQTGTHDINIEVSKDFDETTLVSGTINVGSGTYADAGIWDSSLYGSGEYAIAQTNRAFVVFDDVIELGTFDYIKVRAANANKDEFFRIYAYTIWWKPLGSRYVTT
ncbi:MAG: hypothetical protein ACFFG0_03410 [Candidatus Thorarchaeota archaeon]